MATAIWIGTLAAVGSMNRGFFLGVLMITIAIDLF